MFSGRYSYDDGRRDIRLSIEEHFLEQVQVFNTIVFDDGQRNTAVNLGGQRPLARPARRERQREPGAKKDMQRRKT